MSVFSSEFWRSLYFLGMGGQASVETEPGQMAAILTGSGFLVATISGGEQTAGGGRRIIQKRAKPYVEWAEEQIASPEPEAPEPEPVPIAVRKKLKPAKELERVNAMLLVAMTAASDEAKRKDMADIRKVAKQNKIAPPDNEAEIRAMVYWLVKRAEALRELEDEEETFLLLVA